MTYDKLNDLMHSLSEGDWTDYKTAATARKLLKNIQVECDVARKAILEITKQANPKLFKNGEE